ncbi:hypothetical protein SUGI_0315240 [Cryptomeria japonica]|nr:hypothetical protein SUGI_0315240 [Cryptomeria japonica]
MAGNSVRKKWNVGQSYTVSTGTLKGIAFIALLSLKIAHDEDLINATLSFVSRRTKSLDKYIRTNESGL